PAQLNLKKLPPYSWREFFVLPQEVSHMIESFSPSPKSQIWQADTSTAYAIFLTALLWCFMILLESYKIAMYFHFKKEKRINV
ncbi:MAG: hypothetical protein ACLUDG_02395, partial [Butyricicoccus sp.]